MTASQPLTPLASGESPSPSRGEGVSDFLLELLSEEIPARMQAGARRDLERLFAAELDGAGLEASSVETYATPRRLVLIARGLPAETEATRHETKGPRVGAPEQALSGFLQKYQLTKDQLVERDGVYFAERLVAGQPTSNILAFAIERIIRTFPWPKSMRWGDGSLRWVRPLHGIVAMLGEDIVPVEVDGIASGAATVGHRFHHPGTITVGGAGDYAEKLRACHVIVDQAEREAIIRERAQALAEGAGLALVEDEALVAENAGLTEWPVPLLGGFDAAFLDVPEEVIQLTARLNQKYFVLRDGEGRLAPNFVCTANIDSSDGGQAIVAGNERVLAARLADARFFWRQDLKVPLEVQAEKLSGIVFHEKLGTIADKVERVAKLARWLVEEGVIPLPAREGQEVGAERSEAPGVRPTPGPSLPGRGEVAAMAERAARLAKADLVTGMVGEFPELQGVIGGYLARAQGEPDAIADAVRDHYKPVGQGDDVPTAPVAVAVSLADKLDSLRAFFEIDERPTGSRDPFALRRAALGAIQLIVANGLRLPVASGELLDFFADRLKVQQREAGIRHDLIDAVFALGGEDDLVRLLARVKALQGFVETGEGANLLAAYKRAANILKKERWTGPEVMSSPEEQGIPQTGEEDPLVLVEEPGMAEAVAEMASGSAGADLPQERALVEALDSAEPAAERAIAAEDFTAAMAALAKLRAPIDSFFDNVTVNDPDPAARERRLNLLLRFRQAVDRVADFSRIEG